MNKNIYIYTIFLVSFCLAGCPKQRPTSHEAKPSEPQQAKQKGAAPADPPQPIHVDNTTAKAPPAPEQPCQPEQRKVSGKLTADTTWCGKVEVVDHVLVPAGVTLTVQADTEVRFAPYRGAWEPEKRLKLRVEGRLDVRGAAGRPARFTSGHSEPLNGDWSTVELVNSRGSRLIHAVVEYGQQGLSIDGGQVTVGQSVVRFNNRAGVRARFGARLQVHDSRIYSNGYNGVAFKDGGQLGIEGCYIANSGVVGIHVGGGKAKVVGNLFEGSIEGVYVNDNATIELVANRITAPRSCGVSCDGKNTLRLGNNVIDGVPNDQAICCDQSTVTAIETDETAPDVIRSNVREGTGSYLDYIPGSRGHDAFPYQLPDKHASRQVIGRAGDHIGLIWSVTWDGQALWVANQHGEVKRLDPATGEVKRTFDGPALQPRGMAFAFGRLWINDYLGKKVFAVDPDDGKTLSTFASPDPEGGCRGMTSDGKNLLLLGWRAPYLFVVSPEGKLVDRVPAPFEPLSGGIKAHVAGGLTWDGEALWAPTEYRLVRFSRDGQLLGTIAGTAARTADLAWDGKTVWTTVATNEPWTDLKRLVQVKILKVDKPAKR